MNSDTIQIGDNRCGFGVLFHDGEGNILATVSKSTKQNLDPKLAEVQSLKWGLIMVRDLCFVEMEVESNCF